MMMGALRSSETSVLTRATWRHIPEDGIFHCYVRFVSHLAALFQQPSHQCYVENTGLVCKKFGLRTQRVLSENNDFSL
jgi:hypothetical protein